MKIFVAIALGLILCFPGYGFASSAENNAQASCPDPDVAHEPDMAFCQNDARPEIKAFCKKLARIQTYANANPGADSSCFRALVSNVDLTADLDQTFNNATPTFIYATGPTLALKTAISSVLRDVGQSRPDQQLGASSQSSGTTSLVSKAGSSELLAFAVDSGVLTKSVSGTTTTVGTNADQIFRLVTGNDPDCTITCRKLGWFENKVLNFTNISTAFDLAQQSSTITPTAGQASGTTTVPVNNAAIPKGVGKLSNLTVRYELMNSFDPRSDKFKKAWAAQVPSLADSVSLIGDDTQAVFAILKTHAPWSNADAAALTRAQNARDQLLAAAQSDRTGAGLRNAFEAYWNTVVTVEVLQDTNLAAAVSKAMQDRATYRTAWLKALDQAVGNLFTFEYSFNRPVDQPETSDLKLIYAYNYGKMGMLTFNGTASLYNGALPAGAKYGRLHYGQVSAQYDRVLSSRTSPVQEQLSLAGYWQYQPEPSVLNIPAGTVVPGTNIPLPNGTQEFVGTAGSLWVTQAKLTFKASGGINVPIGVSWSNKTDLLVGSKVGAQIGISYNFASLANLFTGK
jgi:hypothetical protein